MNRVPVALQRRSGTFRPPTLQTLPVAVTANVVKIRARTRSTIMAVVKADGYGHGAVTVAKAAVAAGAGWLGTTTVAGFSGAPRGWWCRSSPGCTAPGSTLSGGSHQGRCRGRVGGRARASCASRVDGAGSSTGTGLSTTAPVGPGPWTTGLAHGQQA